MNIKAIETRYGGYRFRSRTEARWAVFFDTLGVVYEYEKEGYNLGGVLYLPDFWLPEHGIWVEIKPTEPTEEEREKARRLAIASEKNVVIFQGAPWFNIVRCLFTHDESDIARKNGGDFIAEFHKGSDFNEAEKAWIKFDMYRWAWAAWMYYEGEPGNSGIGFFFDDKDVAKAKHPVIADAYKAAREARFERNR